MGAHAPLRQRSIFSGSFPFEEAMKRSAKAIKGAMNILAMLPMHYCGY